MTGRMPQEGINPVEFPEVIAHVWDWFLRLNRKRPASMAGVSPLSELEISCFFMNRGVTPDGWVFDALDLLDAVAIESAHKEK